MNKAASKLINKYLGDFIENLNSDQLDVSIFSGKILLENITLKNDILQLLGIPFELRHAKVGKIQVSIPWGNLLSKPLRVELSNIFIYLTPNHSSTWSETNIKENLVRSKSSYLEKFESIQEKEIQFLNSPNMFERWLIKIIENVQVIIKNIYIRFEDDVTSQMIYSIGVVLEELTAETHNENWEVAYNNDSKMCYKLVKVTNFSVFCDYDVEMLSFQKFYEEEIGKAFARLASDEFATKINHNYILLPFSLEVQITASKVINPDYPIIHAQVNFGLILLNIYTGQIFALLHLVELIKLFTVFRAGIIQSLEERDFSQSEIEAYKALYMDFYTAYRANETKKSEKISKNLAVLEKNIKLVEIEKIRNQVICSFNKEKIVNDKLKEIEKLNREHRGFFSKFKKMIGNISQEEFEEKENLEKSKIAHAESELDELVNMETSLYRKENNEPSDWLKVLLMVQIHEFSVTVIHEKSILYVLSLKSMNVAMGLKRSLFLDLQISSIVLKDFSQDSRFFPFFFEFSKINLMFEEKPLKINFSSGETYIYCLLESFSRLAEIIEHLFLREIDISDYKNKIADQYHKYLQFGQEYLSEILSIGDPIAIDLNLNLKAPIIIIPTDSMTNSSCLVIDLGIVACHTADPSQIYSQFDFALENFGIFVVWQWNNIKEWKNSFKDEIFCPIMIKATISQMIIENRIGLEIVSSISDTVIVFSPITLRFLSDMQGKIINLIPSFMKIHSTSKSIEGKIIENSEGNQKIPEMLPMFIVCSLENLKIQFREIKSNLAEICFKKIKSSIDIDSKGNLILKTIILNFHIDDCRKNASFEKIVHNPYIAKSEIQIQMDLKVDAIRNIVDIGIIVEDLRIVASSSFAFLVIDFIKNNAEVLKFPTLTQKWRKVAYYIDTIKHLRVNILCPSIEFWFPSETSSKIAEFTFTCALVVTEQRDFRIFYSNFNFPISFHQLSMTQEVQLLTTRFSGKIIDSQDLAWEKALVSQARFDLNIFSTWKDSDKLQNDLFNIKAEPLEIFFSMEDLSFFMSVVQPWLDFPQIKLLATDFHMNIQCNYIQIQVNTYRKSKLLSLFCVKLQKVALKYFENDTVKNAVAQVELTVNYFNNKYLEWEPCLEKWIFAANFSLGEEKIEIGLQSLQTLNLNFTHYLVEQVVTVLNILTEKPQITSEDSNNKQEIEYRIENSLKVPLIIWINIGKYQQKITISEESSYSFSNSLIKSLKAIENEKIAWTSKMAFLNSPLLLGFKFSENTNNEHFISLEEVSVKVFNVSLGIFQFPCFVHSIPQGNLRVIRFQTGVFIATNFEDCRKIRSLNFEEIKDIEGVRVECNGIKNIEIKDTAVIVVENIPKLCVEIHDYQIDVDTKITVIELNPVFVIKNSLPHDISIFFSDSQSKIIKSGEKKDFDLDVTLKYSIEILGLSRRTFSDPFDLFSDTKDLLLDLNEYFSIGLLYSKNEITDYKDPSFSNFAKKSRNPKKHSCVIEIYTKYFFINCTQIGLDLSGLEIPAGEFKYSSKCKKKIRAKTTDVHSKYSSAFRIDTIGVSGILQIDYDDIRVPKETVVGIVVKQAPGFMHTTKIVSFVPRFKVWNFLEIDLYLKQTNSEVPTLLPKKCFESPSFLLLELEDYVKSKEIQVATEEDQYSSYFKIETIEDFQIKMPSKLSPAEEELSVFESKWFIPSPANNFHRFIRVIISSSNEATIHISFMPPKDPDFRIVNKSEHIIQVRQAGENTTITVGKYQSIEWAWENLVSEYKKVQIECEGLVQNYSLEKVKEFVKKPIFEASVSVVINGITRELWVKGPEYEAALLKNQSLSSQDFLISKDGNQEIILNPRHAIQNSLVPMNELVDSMDQTLLKSVGKALKLEIFVKIADIGLSLLDLRHEELFYLNIQGLKLNAEIDLFSLETRQKINTKLFLGIKHLQIDVLDKDPNVFHVLLYPVRREKETEGDKKYYFLMVELEHTLMLQKKQDESLEQKHIFENLEVAFQEIGINVHEDTVCKILNFRHLLVLFQQVAAKANIFSKIMQDTTVDSTFSPEKSTLKAYFRFLKLRALKINLTVRQSTRQVDLGFYDDSIFFNIFRVIAGAFANISPPSFTFKEVYLLNAFQSIPALLQILARQYLRQAVLQFYKLIGSIDLIGNPLNLINKLGTGVFELFAEPAKALLGGPKSFAKGLGKGVKSLISGVLSGGFETISKMSGTLYDVLKRATDDEKFHKYHSESISKSFVLGLGEGFLDLVNGFTHLVLKPYHGAKKRGFKGFFKGCLFGGLGLVSSPFKFVLKLTHTFSSTISATTLLVFKGKLQRYGRTRFPRYFSLDKILHPYDPETASAIAVFEKIEKAHNQILVYFCEGSINKSEIFSDQKSFFLFLTTEFLIYLLEGDAKKIVKIDGIKEIQVHLWENIYFLAVVTEKENFVVVSEHESGFKTILNMVENMNPHSHQLDGHKFERPDFMVKGGKIIKVVI